MSAKWFWFSVIVFALALAFVATSVFGKDKVVVYQTLPNSQVRDYRAPVIVTEKTKSGTVVYQTLPNSQVRDYRAPAYRVNK